MIFIDLQVIITIPILLMPLFGKRMSPLFKHDMSPTAPPPHTHRDVLGVYRQE